VVVWDIEAGKWLSRFSGMDVPLIRIGAARYGNAISVAFLSTSNLVAVCGGALAVLRVGADLTLLSVTSPAATTKDALEIRALGVSADGKRLAVAGMRMASRPGAWAAKGDVVFDVPQYGEIQVWDAVQLRLRLTIHGRARGIDSQDRLLAQRTINQENKGHRVTPLLA
jgi:hypothetical protein